MLRAVHSHRVEDLRDALLDALPPADPFAPSTIVVGSQLVARWLTKEIALARGIASGLELLTFDRFVERTWGEPRTEAGHPELGCIDRKRLGAAFASVLADDRIVRELGPIAAYLAAAPAPGDRAGPRRVQLAEHLAELAWSYMLTRPDWVPGLIAGHVPSELAEDDAAHWQVRLASEALARLSSPDSVRVPAPMLPWMRRRAGLPTPRCAPLAVFGLSFLARAQLEALTDLATTTDVTIYVLDPCEELWDDVLGRAALARATSTDGEPTAAVTSSDPLPLVLWGRPVRDTLSSLVERTAGDLDARFATPSEGRTARDRLLADVRARRGSSHEAALVAVRDLGDGEAGVTVLACPNPRREIEVIATEVRDLIDRDPSLCAHELAVWIAGDAEQYLAQAPAAFEAVGVPCHLIDAPIDDRGRIGEAVLALLELPTGAMSRRELLRVMTHPAVLAGHPHVDAADWVRWTERLGIVHGADGHAHEGTYLADHPGHFHWEQGVRRLALGAFMVGDRGQTEWRGAVNINGDLFAPEEVRADQQASAATYALLVRSLCADAAWLAERMAPLSTWADMLAALVDDYLAPRDEESRRDLERVRNMLASLAAFDIDGRAVGFREAREYVVRMFASARANRGEPLAGGVMIAPLAAMRAVPFRIAFVAGLDEGAFPASEHGSPLDLRTAMRAGDVSPRDRDRAAFLDVVLCAREALYLSYVAVEPRSGQPLGPSSIVLELADALAPYLGAPSSREALASITVRHPLHRFAPVSEHGTPQPDRARPDVARERWACAVRDALHAHLRTANHPIPDADGQLALLAHPSQAPLRAALGIHDAPLPSALEPSRSLDGSRDTTISNLRGFLEYPIQAWALAVLGFDELPDDSTIEHSDEPFHLGRAERTMLLREVLAAHLRDPAGELAARYDATVRDLQLRGQFPVGVFAEAARTLDLAILERWQVALGPLARGAALGATPNATRIGFGRAWSRGAQLRPPLQVELSGDRAVRVIGQTELLLDTGERKTSVVALVRTLDKKTHYHIRGALDHVVLAAAGLAPAGHVHKLLGSDGSTMTVTHDPWSPREASEYLATLIADLLDAPHGYLLPFEGLVRALAGTRPAARYRDMTQGLGFGPIERADGLRVPADAFAIAQRRLAPLVERMRGDHGFEVHRP